MNINEVVILVSIVLALLLNALYIGYVLGQKQTTKSVESIDHQSFFTKNNVQYKSTKEATPLNNAINIDESKVVISVDIGDVEKKYNQLGDTVTSTENISNSIDKLKNLKK
jgi:hypothetical protein